ncbi:MAG: sigma factor [Eubacteriales bacterium]|nr:sigma factor [Eubacteriales bacterium]
MQSDQTLDEQVIAWQSSHDEIWAERLMTKYRPFILKTVASVSGRYIEIENDDEFSIGLQAFYEAMNRFDHRGSFLAFAKLVIASRIKSYWQKENRNQTVCLDELDVVADDVDQLINELSMAQDIQRFSGVLADYNLTFSLLATKSPRHRDTREAVLSIAKRIAASERLLEMLRKKKRLPIREIVLQLAVSPKVVKRNKVYLLAAVLVFTQPDTEMAAWLRAVSGDPVR